MLGDGVRFFMIGNKKKPYDMQKKAIHVLLYLYISVFVNFGSNYFSHLPNKLIVEWDGGVFMILKTNTRLLCAVN